MSENDLNKKIQNKSTELVKGAKNMSIPANLSGAKSSVVLDVLNAYKHQIAQAVPKHLSPDRLIQIACNLIVSNPKIAECSTKSIVGAVMQASILGFKPVNTLGQCYFVPYSKEVQFQIGYKGYISLARRSGEIKMIYAEVVREGDEFVYTMGLNPDMKHKPKEDGAEDRKLTHAYAVVHYKDGGYNFVVLTYKQIEGYRKRSPMQRDLSGAWKTDYEAMAKKTAIRRLATYMPLDTEVEETLATDERVINAEDFVPDQKGEVKIENIKEVEYTEEETDLSNLENQFEGKEDAK